MTDTITQQNDLPEEQVVETPEKLSVPANTNTSDVGQDYTALKGVILNLSVKLDELKTKQKDYRERLKNILENDAQLSTYEEQASEAGTAFKKRKEELMNSVEAKESQAKMKETNEEVKDIEESLNNHLLNYYQMTGVRSIETPDGDEREFKVNARLLPSKRK